MYGKNVVDQNGKTKTVLKVLLLSKERECYKGIDKQQEIPSSQYSQKQYQDTSKEENLESNLPVKQNIFSRFFSKIRSKFSKQSQNKTIQRKDNIQQYEKPQIGEKKYGELDADEKAEIQRKTAEVVKRYREQEEQHPKKDIKDMEL